jgi:hypothetical protein
MTYLLASSNEYSMPQDTAYDALDLDFTGLLGPSTVICAPNSTRKQRPTVADRRHSAARAFVQFSNSSLRAGISAKQTLVLGHHWSQLQFEIELMLHLNYFRLLKRTLNRAPVSQDARIALLDHLKEALRSATVSAEKQIAQGEALLTNNMVRSRFTDAQEFSIQAVNPVEVGLFRLLHTVDRGLLVANDLLLNEVRDAATVHTYERDLRDCFLAVCRAIKKTNREVKAQWPTSHDVE